MIKKIRIKFIATFMSIMLVLFSSMYGFIYWVIHAQNSRSIDKELTNLYSIYDEYGQTGVSKYQHVILIDESNNVYYYDSTIFAPEEIQDIYGYAVEQKVTFGNAGVVYYKFFETDNQTVFIASDRTTNLQNLHRSSIDIIWPMLGLYVLTFFIVWLVSYKTFAPIKETFNKQRRFISDASHELKTPTTIISANAEVLKEIQDSQWVDNIKSQTERLNTLIADMLDLSKMDEGKVKFIKETIDATQIVTDVTLSFDAVAYERKKQLDFDIAPDVTIVGDTNSFKKIVIILLDNAVKHAEENGEIKVTLKSNGENKAILTVYNTGSFIPDEQVDKVFERFYRGENSRNRQYGGSGLGLSIAQSLAKANKWKLTAKSNLYESMEFTLTI